jgi:hypothetical protein
MEPFPLAENAADLHSQAIAALEQPRLSRVSRLASGDFCAGGGRAHAALRVMLRAKLGGERVASAHFEALIIETSLAEGDDRSAVSNGGHLDIEHEARRQILKRKHARCGAGRKLPGARRKSAICGKIEQKTGASEDCRGRALSQTETVGLRAQDIAPGTDHRARPDVDRCSTASRCAASRPAVRRSAASRSAAPCSASPYPTSRPRRIDTAACARDVSRIDHVERRGFTAAQEREGAEHACDMRKHFPCCAIETAETMTS